jgi:hypothetical protein
MLRGGTPKVLGALLVLTLATPPITALGGDIFRVKEPWVDAEFSLPTSFRMILGGFTLNWGTADATAREIFSCPAAPAAETSVAPAQYSF